MEDYLADLTDQKKLPLGRAYTPTPVQSLIREMILQMKKGYLDVHYFNSKFNTNIIDDFEETWRMHQQEEFLVFDNDRVTLTRKGLLRVDGLLPPFFEEQFQGVRYT
jgi:oxygen-independent coproporphyrinogen-3 oxidase